MQDNFHAKIRLFRVLFTQVSAFHQTFKFSNRSFCVVFCSSWWSGISQPMVLTGSAADAVDALTNDEDRDF